MRDLIDSVLIGGYASYLPVSYTHLDVYKRQTIFLQNEHLFGDLNRPGAPTLGRFLFYSKILSVSSEYKEELSGSSSSDD